MDSSNSQIYVIVSKLAKRKDSIVEKIIERKISIIAPKHQNM